MGILNHPIILTLGKSPPFAIGIVLFVSFLSVYSWAIIIIKFMAFRKMVSVNREFIASFEKSTRMDQKVVENNSPYFRLFVEARTGMQSLLNEMLQSFKDKSTPSLYIETQFNVLRDNLDRIISRENEKNQQYLIYLAIISTVSPLLGLLGTVWGIMDSFIEIGKMGQANLAVVAPGVASALITTIWGLFVAIPSLVFYNYFASYTRRLEENLHEYSLTLINRVRQDFFRVVYAASPK
jgi:biopolymer transport protein TolQ